MGHSCGEAAQPVPHLRRAVRRGADAVIDVRRVAVSVKEELRALARRHRQRGAARRVVDDVEVRLHVRRVPREAVRREAGGGRRSGQWTECSCVKTTKHTHLCPEIDVGSQSGVSHVIVYVWKKMCQFDRGSYRGERGSRTLLSRSLAQGLLAWKRKPSSKMPGVPPEGMSSRYV